ncbi:MAG: hypothetical protein WBH14_16250 [Albidovulum sp.]
MLSDDVILLVAIKLGAAIQAGVGVGFSIVVAPIMMVMMGTAVAVPILLMLNTLVSAVALDRRVWAFEKALIKNAAIGCLVGISLGLLIHPYLSEWVILSLTAGLLLIGVATSVLPIGSGISPAGFKAVSVLSGARPVRRAYWYNPWRWWLTAWPSPFICCRIGRLLPKHRGWEHSR